MACECSKMSDCQFGHILNILNFIWISVLASPGRNYIGAFSHLSLPTKGECRKNKLYLTQMSTGLIV